MATTNREGGGGTEHTNILAQSCQAVNSIGTNHPTSDGKGEGEKDMPSMRKSTIPIPNRRLSVRTLQPDAAGLPQRGIARTDAATNLRTLRAVRSQRGQRSVARERKSRVGEGEGSADARQDAKEKERMTHQLSGERKDRSGVTGMVEREALRNRRVGHRRTLDSIYL